MKNILKDFNYEEHKQRLLNLQLAERSILTHRGKHMIADYIPGHFIYRGRKPGLPEEDEKLFSYLEENGVGLLQLWSGWYKDKTWQGREMYTYAEPEKIHAFLDLAHQHHIKVLPYTSTNFYERTHDFFNPAWAYSKDFDLVEFDYHLAHCSPNSPGWRAHILRQMARLMDEYEFDGLYNDTGYARRSDYPHTDLPLDIEDEIPTFPENRTLDGGMDDLLGLIYHEVKQRNGIYKLHMYGSETIRGTQRIYDYLWVGEGDRSLDKVRERTKNYAPYVVPDFNFHTDNEAERYLNTIPYLQFPVLRDGTVGIASVDAAVPDTELAMNWFRLYKKMATEGAWHYMDVEAPTLIRRKGWDTVASLFVNLDFYIVLANFSEREDTVVLNGDFVLCDPVKGESPVTGEIKIPARNLVVVRRKNEIV